MDIVHSFVDRDSTMQEYYLSKSPADRLPRRKKKSKRQAEQVRLSHPSMLFNAQVEKNQPRGIARQKASTEIKRCCPRVVRYRTLQFGIGLMMQDCHEQILDFARCLALDPDNQVPVIAMLVGTLDLVQVPTFPVGTDNAVDQQIVLGPDASH